MEVVGGVASVIQIVQTAWWLSVKIKKLIVKIKEQDEDVQQLEEKADTLGAIIQEVENAYGPQEDQGLPGELGRDNLRTLVNDAISRCKDDLEDFAEELSKLLIKRHTIADSVLRRWRQQTAAPTLARIAKSIESHQLSLQLLIQILHGRSLENTRQVMAQGFFAVLASNRKMFAMLQGLTGPQQGLTRQDTESTLVPQPDDNEAEGQTVFSDENEAALHQFFKRIFEVWLKNNAADSASPVLAKQSASPDDSLNSSPSTIRPSKWAADSFGGYTMDHRRRSRPSSPSIDPTETDSANPLRPIISSPSIHSRTSSLSTASFTSVLTRSTSAQTSDYSRLAGRNSRSPKFRKVNDRSMSVADTCLRLDTEGFDPARMKGMEMHDCIPKNDFQSMERLLENGATLEERDPAGKTPLLLAASQGSVDAVNSLLRKGADPRARNNTEETALHLAIRCKSGQALIPYLLRPPNLQQSDFVSKLHNLVNAHDATGRTPLHECARYGESEWAERLVAHDANINARDNSGHPPAYYAMKKKDEKKKFEIIELLVRKNADFGDFEWPPPHEVSREIEKLLKDNGWTRPPGPAKQSPGSGSKSKRPDNRRTSMSWPRARTAS